MSRASNELAGLQVCTQPKGQADAGVRDQWKLGRISEAMTHLPNEYRKSQTCGHLCLAQLCRSSRSQLASSGAGKGA